MRCPYCHTPKDSLKVIDSRPCDGDRSIRRRRECMECGKRFTTYERVEDPVRLTVVKRDGRRVPWDREKIVAGLERACFKRPVPESEVLRIAEEVEEECRRRHDRECPSSFVGEQVIERLRRVDQVAYVRFASVYHRFQIEELAREAQAVLDRRRSDDPSQGKLFVEASAPPAAAPSAKANGRPLPNKRRRANVPTVNGDGTPAG